MPFLALLGPILGATGAVAGGALGASAMGIAAAGGLAGGLIQANQDKQKALGLAGQAANASQVNIDQLNEQTKEISRQNALDSAALEKSLTPEVPMLRQQANQALMASMGQDTGAGGMVNGLQQLQNPGVQTPLLQAAIAKARADLGLGGQLSVDQRNEATRQGLAEAGSFSGGANLGLGRDLAARDLGLTSYQVENQRLQNASALGGQELQQQLGAGSQAFQFGNANNNTLLAQIQMLQAIQNQKFGQNLATAQYGQSIQQPLVGLDPGAAANIAVSNANNAGGALANQANIYGQSAQNNQRFAGQALGYGLMNYNQFLQGGANPYIGTNSVTPTSGIRD